MRTKSYRVRWQEARTYEHPHPNRTARIGRSYADGIGGAEEYTFQVYPTREKMLDAYYKHGRSCTSAPHPCVMPLVRV